MGTPVRAGPFTAPGGRSCAAISARPAAVSASDNGCDPEPNVQARTPPTTSATTTTTAATIIPITFALRRRSSGGCGVN
ncbi:MULTISPECIES: hypothetical protein [unclassified Mycolicibacterium]|uniref:hypothetical protein n=1 Tax=unclassified Mycolicibacterium TaxID=2636767 RepID=UPI001391715B|nr:MULTISPECIES: hypothetical protein [unclassified Mycolicibacterium]